jgi:[ribosomal protein S18]-alanine N-acetyltransferase
VTWTSADRLRVRPMSSADAHEVADWRYERPWAVYDGGGTPLDTANYWAVVDDADRLLGYYCIGAEARVPGLDVAADTLDLGVGMRPDLVGAGNGRAFAVAVLAHCRKTRNEGHVRAVVQSWNERSLRLAFSMGFTPTGTHECVQGTKTVIYTVLVAALPPQAEPR